VATFNSGIPYPNASTAGAGWPTQWPYGAITNLGALAAKSAVGSNDLSGHLNGSQVDGAVPLATAASTAMNAPGVHYYVYANGWSKPGYPRVWTTDSGSALQGALNDAAYYASSNIVFTSSQGIIYLQNNASCGGVFELSAESFENTNQSPFTISNQIANSSWTLIGQGYPNTKVIGASNVLRAAVITDYPCALIDIEKIAWCWRSNQSKAIALDLDRSDASLRFINNSVSYRARLSTIYQSTVWHDWSC
jgi:hypothetical protein